MHRPDSRSRPQIFSIDKDGKSTEFEHILQVVKKIMMKEQNSAVKFVAYRIM